MNDWAAERVLMDTSPPPFIIQFASLTIGIMDNILLKTNLPVFHHSIFETSV
jgi:hypothetical protein